LAKKQRCIRRDLRSNQRPAHAGSSLNRGFGCREAPCGERLPGVTVPRVAAPPARPARD
jgi:hypothetical protein